MQSAIVNVRVDSEDKKQFEEFCNSVGMNVSTAINMFIKNVIKERRLPFEVRSLSFEDYIYEKIKEAEKDIDNDSKKYTLEEVMESAKKIIGDK